MKVALYRHYDKDNILLYVGISLSAVARLKQHQSKADWTSRAILMKTEWFDKRDDALEAEKIAIKAENPLFNLVHNKNTEFENPATYMLIDRVTGEEVDIDLFIKNTWDDYWERNYAKTLAEYINVTGSNSNKVLAFLIKNKTVENIINGTVRSIAEDAGASHVTVANVFKVLQKSGLLKKIRNGCYLLSPHILRHGSKTRGAMLIRMWEQ